jgi:uncharacterized membrane protein
VINIICQELEKKMNTLKDFAESVHEVPQVRMVERLAIICAILFLFLRAVQQSQDSQVLRRFLLIRAGSIDDITQLKAWASASEAEDKPICPQLPFAVHCRIYRY